MKVLFLHNYFHVESGSNVVMFQESELFKRQGHDVYFFCTDKKPYYDENYEFIKDFPRHFDFKKLNLKDKLLNLHTPFYNKDAVKKFGMFLDKVRPDVVHEHTTSFNLTHSVLNECYKRKIPVFVTIHGPSYFCPSGNLLFRKEKFCEKIHCKGLNKFHCIINNCYEGSLVGQLYKILVYMFYRACGCHKKASGYICPSKAIFDLAIKAGIPYEKLFLVDNFLDNKSNIYENLIPDKESKGYFLYVGRLVKGKGIYNLIEAWKKLPSEIELHIAGTGEEENNLRQLINKYNLNNIKLIGFKDKSELEREYRGCIASILPSIGFEAFGLTILESFSFNKPVIASNIGGIPEIIKHTKNGILVEPGNIKELEEAVLKLYKDSELVMSMGMKGKQTAESNFTPQAHYNKLINVYERFVNNRQ